MIKTEKIISTNLHKRIKNNALLIRLYSRQWFRTLASSLVRVQENKPYIFIVGCYNSGTTLLDYMLGQHKEISGLPSEGAALTGEIPRPEDIGWNRMWHMCRDQVEINRLKKKPDPQQIKKDWAFWFEKGKFFLEKSIINSLNIDWLEESFNHPYFIWILRNGYAVAEGIHRRTSQPGRHPSRYIGGYPLDMCARQWMVNNEVIKEKITKSKNHIRIYYEDLTESPKDTIEKILEWLPIYEKKVIFDQKFTFQGKAAKIKNMNSESISRLSSGQIETITEIAGDMLKHHNYVLLR